MPFTAEALSGNAGGCPCNSLAQAQRQCLYFSISTPRLRLVNFHLSAGFAIVAVSLKEIPDSEKKRVSSKHIQGFSTLIFFYMAIYKMTWTFLDIKINGEAESKQEETWSE